MIDKNHNAASVQEWFAARGDATHRLNYPLDSNSLILDIGGYQGNWAEQIHNKYNATIHVFEPIKFKRLKFIDIKRNYNFSRVEFGYKE